MRDLTPPPRIPALQVRLERDGVSEDCRCLRFEPRGAVFAFHSRIELMSDLLIRIEQCGPGCQCRRLLVEGIVIGCRQTGDRSFETLVYFPTPVDGRHAGGMGLTGMQN